MPPSLSNKSLIFGIGKGFHLILLFNFLKSEMKHTDLSFFGIIKAGAEIQNG